MILTLTPTSQVTTLEHEGNTMPARIWEGHDEFGAPVHVYITRVAVHKDEPPEVHERFSTALEDCPAPTVRMPTIIVI